MLSSEIYGGEVYDARLEVAGWNAPGFKASGWTDAVTGTVPSTVKLTAQPDLSINNSITLHPAAMKARRMRRIPYSSTWGQNMVGNIALAVHGPRGTVVRMRLCRAHQSRWQHLHRRIAQRDRDGHAYALSRKRRRNSTRRYLM